MALTKPLIDLLNKVDPPMRIMLHTVPLRIIRVTATDESMTAFRVEQLSISNKDRNNPRGDWHTLSTHAGTVTGGSFPAACKAAVQAQADLRHKLEGRMAAIQEARL
jgi:hypothetical protein